MGPEREGGRRSWADISRVRKPRGQGDPSQELQAPGGALWLPPDPEKVTRQGAWSAGQGCVHNAEALWASTVTADVMSHHFVAGKEVGRHAWTQHWDSYCFSWSHVGTSSSSGQWAGPAACRPWSSGVIGFLRGVRRLSPSDVGKTSQWLKGEMRRTRLVASLLGWEEDEEWEEALDGLVLTGRVQGSAGAGL